MGLRHIDAGGVTLAVTEACEGGRPLLAVHGFTGAKEDFTELVAPLAEDGWHVVAPDLRGHGASDCPAGQDAYDLGFFVSDVLGVADALGFDRVALIGHSMGGAVAQRLALDHPHRVTQLVLMSTFHGPLPLDPDVIGLGVAIVSSGGMAALGAAMAARRAGDPAAQASRERMERSRPGYGAWADAKLEACSADMWMAMAPRFPAWPDTLDEVRSLDVPTLVVCGSEDETMGPQCEALASAIPGARLAVIEGTRHSPQVEDPERTLAALRRFLDETVPIAAHEEDRA
ncbi:MAG: alpha/beta fold hydrolase [Acidimicrobiales bacterium]